MLQQQSLQIQFTTARNPQVSPNELYINLHTNDQLGCVGNEGLLLDTTYYNPQALVENGTDDIQVFLPLPLNLDTILSLYIIQQQIFNETNLQYSTYNFLKGILDKQQSTTPINLHSIFLAITSLNEALETIEKMFKLLDALNIFKQTEKLSDAKYSSNLLERLPYLSNEIALLKHDFELFQEEQQNVLVTQKDSLLVATYDGTVSTTNVTVYLRDSQCMFVNYWLMMQNIGVVVHLKSLETGNSVQIGKLSSAIDFTKLPQTLSFFEHYYSEGASTARWTDNGMISCQNSRLTKDQLLDLLKSNTDPYVTNQQVKYVFPFHFDYTKFKLITKYLQKKFESVDESETHKNFRDTFLPLFNDYFFNNEKLSKKQSHSKSFTLTNDAFVAIKGNKACFSFENDEDIEGLFTRTLNIEVRQFRYGVGFLTLETSYCPNTPVPLNYILDIDKLICNKVQNVFQFFLGSHPDIKTNATRRGIAYESIEIQQTSYYKERKENLVLKTCSANKRTYISDADELKQELDEKFLSRGDFVFYGFSRSCGVQYLVDNGLSGKNGFRKLSNNFMDEKFYVFLFVAQQRDAIRQFSDKLVGSSIVKQKLKANRIRKDFIDFMTQVKLSHVSDHNVVTRFYNRWRTIFDSESIFLEVSEKLDALDGYQQSKVSHQFNILSFIVFPIVAISSLFTMGILATTPFEIDIKYVIGSSIILMGIFYFFSKKK